MAKNYPQKKPAIRQSVKSKQLLAQSRIVEMVQKFSDAPLQSRSRKAALNRLLRLRRALSYQSYLALRGYETPSNFKTISSLARPMIPITSKQFMVPLIEFYSCELKGFEWVNLLLSLPKVDGLTFIEDISETVNTIWAVQDMTAHFPGQAETHTHEPLSRSIIIQSTMLDKKPKSSIELIVNLVYETAMIDLYLNYPEYYSGTIGKRLAHIQVQIFLNVASGFYANLQRYQPFSRVLTPKETIQLIADGGSHILDEFVRLDNENAAAIANCNKLLNLDASDINLYI